MGTQTRTIDATPTDMSFVTEAMIAQIERYAEPDCDCNDCFIDFKQYALELSDATYLINGSIVVYFEDIDHSGDGTRWAPQPDVIIDYHVTDIEVIKCLPDEQYKLNITEDGLERELLGPRLWK